MAEWWRSALIRVIDLAVSAVVFAALELSGFFGVIFPSGFLAEPLLHFLAVLLVMTFLLSWISRWMAGQIFKSYYRAWNLSAQSAHADAATAYREQIEFLERNPWIDQLRTVILRDPYKETLAERMWFYLANTTWLQGDRAQAMSCFEKSLEINPNGFLGLYSLSIIRARAGEPPLPFRIPKQQLTYGGGFIGLLVLLFVFNTCWSMFANILFLFADDGSPFSSSYLVISVAIATVLVMTNILDTSLGWLINQAIQAGYHSAHRMVAAGNFDEAARAFEQDVRYWRDHIGLQKLQRFLFDVTPRSYLERALWAQGAVAIRLGKPEVFASAYREILAANPESDVRVWLRLYEDPDPQK